MTAAVISFANHKGGVGKSTSVINLADALVREDFSVLILDMDPQGNTTKTIGTYHSTTEGTIASLLTGDEVALINSLQEVTKIPGVSLIGSTIKLTPLEEKIRGNEFGYSPATLLRQKIKPLLERFDFILIDCPPALGMLTANALAASSHYLIPTEAGSKFGIDGLDDLDEAIKRIKSINPELVFLGCLAIKFDARKNICGLIMSQVRSRFGSMVFNTTISDSTKFNQAISLQKSVLMLDRKSRPAREYAKVAREILLRLGINPKKSADPDDLSDIEEA